MNAEQLAKIHGVKRPTIYQWLASQPPLPRRDDGSFIVAETIAWRIQRELEKAKRAAAPDGDAPKLSEMNRKLRAEAELKELQLERERGALIPAEEHEEIVSRIAGGFSAVASGQLTRFERRIVQAATPADARVLTQEIHRALMEGAQGLADALDAEADALEKVPDEEAA